MFTKTKKSIGIALAGALALAAWSGAASAITVGGVTWDENSPLDLTVNSVNFRESAIDPFSPFPQTLMGYGQVGTINSALDSVFCASGAGCDLGFTFTYSARVIAGNHILFDLGTVNLYVLPDGSFDVTDPSSASNGTLWLGMDGHYFDSSAADCASSVTLCGTVVGTIGDPQTGSNGFGYLDVNALTPGLAGHVFDNCSIDDGSGGCADFLTNSSFLTDVTGFNPCDTSGVCYPITGTALIQGLTVVPEPSELGLLGLGLGFLGVLAWRRRKEAEGRA